MNEPAITVTGLHKAYKKNQEVIKDLAMTVPKGAVYALLGKNGVGKSTTIRMLMGQLQPDAGAIRVLGCDPIRDGVKMKRKVAYVAENQRLYDWMTMMDLINFTRSFYPQWNDADCSRLLKKFELPPDGRIKDFSRGMYTKATLLAALCREPELLILDDPTLGLDTAARREFMSGVVEAIHEFDRTVIFSTHIIPEIEGLVDYVGIMSEGKLTVEEPLDTLKEELREVRLPMAERDKLAALPGASRVKEFGDEAAVVIRGGPDRIDEMLRQAGIARSAAAAMSLEDIFLALT